jgi:hypothetical protein
MRKVPSISGYEKRVTWFSNPGNQDISTRAIVEYIGVVKQLKIKSYCLFPQSFSSVKIQIFVFCNDFRHVFDIAIMQK